MRISTWITSLYICGLISVNKVVGEAFEVGYGDPFGMFCRGPGGTLLSGDWLHNGISTGVNSNEYDIVKADFSHDGEYQCKRNGVDVLNPPLEIIVYGQRSIIPVNCNSMSNGVCVMNVIRGQPVTLCTTFTTIPHLIPKGKHVSNFSYSAWSLKNTVGNDDYLYVCTTSSCELNPSLDYSLYTYVNISCLTINNVQESHQYTLYAVFEPHDISQTLIFNIVSVEHPVANISVTQGEILCSTRDSTAYPGDRYCLYVEDSGGERHEVECDDRPVSEDVEELMKLGNTVVCTVNRTILDPPVYNDTTYEIPGRGSIVPLNCNSMSNDVCVMNVIRGQPVTLCTTFTTIPPLIPEGKHVSHFSHSAWSFKNTVGSDVYLYGCTTSSCSEMNLTLNYSLYTYVNISCLTINDVQENQQYTLHAVFVPHDNSQKLIFNVASVESPVADISHIVNRGEILCSTQDSTTYPGDRYCLYVEDSGGERHEVECDDLPVSGDVEELKKLGKTAVCTVNRTILNPPVYNDTAYEIPESPFPVISVSVAVVVVVIIMAVVVSFTTATIIVIKYKHSRLTTNPIQSDSPQEPPSSSPSNLTVYRKKDVKRFEKIGRGSFWKVYRGKLSDSRCAIKRLRGVKKGGDHEGLVSKVLRELDMWSSLNHPNIISLYGIYHEDDVNIPLLIVELMDKNLTDQLNSTFDPTHRKSLFPLKTKLSILSQVAGALDYLHCIKRVVHGDLTANNILLKENSPGSFTSKLTDFGMSRALNEQDNVMSTIQGTYSYMPPEVQNAGETTTKVDIYSFGVLCVHVLSHRFPKPLHALTMDDSGARVVVSEFSRYRPYLMELDDDEKLLEPLIEECLQYEPKERLCPEEVIGQLNSIERRLSLKETDPANRSHQPSVIHQQFSGPIVSGCTISGSVMNVGSFTDRNMQSLPVADIAPLPAPLDVIPEVSFGDNMPSTPTSLTALLENPA